MCSPVRQLSLFHLCFDVSLAPPVSLSFTGSLRPSVKHRQKEFSYYFFLVTFTSILHYKLHFKGFYSVKCAHFYGFKQLTIGLHHNKSNQETKGNTFNNWPFIQFNDLKFDILRHLKSILTFGSVLLAVQSHPIALQLQRGEVWSSNPNPTN